jgi:predicted nucleic acid-binding protein
MRLAYIDTASWITLIEGKPSHKQVIRKIFRTLKTESWQPCFSEAVLLETLCKPHKDKNHELISIYETVFEGASKFFVYKDLFEDALNFTQKEKLNPMDAIHLAFAHKYNCKLFVTTDSHFKNLNSIKPLWIDLNQAV